MIAPWSSPASPSARSNDDASGVVHRLTQCGAASAYAQLLKQRRWGCSNFPPPRPAPRLPSASRTRRRSDGYRTSPRHGFRSNLRRIQLIEIKGLAMASPTYIVPFNKAPYIAYLFISLSALILCISISSYISMQTNFRPISVRLFDIFMFVVASLYGYFGVRKLLDKTPALVLDTNGITNNCNCFPVHFIAWDEISRIEVERTTDSPKRIVDWQILIRLRSPATFFSYHQVPARHPSLAPGRRITF